MPVLKNTEYNPGLLYKSSYFQTAIPTLFRKVKGIEYRRERIETPDDDFIDLDFSEVSGSSDTAAVICHGLEGSSERAYMKGMASAFNKIGMDAVCFNLRGCSGEINRQLKMYTAGDTTDLDFVVKHLLDGRYSSIVLAGFSLGGNLILKYAGEKSSQIDKRIKAISAISVPSDLKDSSVELHRPKNYLFQKRFIIMLKNKIKLKMERHPEIQNIDFTSIKTLKDFDDLVTAPVNGFKDAEDYWINSSCDPWLENIKVPSLILNSFDDPILGEKCFPLKKAEESDFLFLEITKYGGHVGFMPADENGLYYSEKRTVEFTTVYL